MVDEGLHIYSLAEPRGWGGGDSGGWRPAYIQWLSQEGEWWTATYCSHTCAAARFLMRAPSASGQAKCNRSDDQWPLMSVWKATKRKEKWRASGVHTFS